MGINIRDFINIPIPFLQQHVDSVQTSKQTKQDWYLGEIKLSFISSWVEQSKIITEIPYSLTDTPIFQDFSKEDYIYYGSIPTM